MRKIKIKNGTWERPIGKLVCVGRNYAEHAKEMGNEIPKEPLLFLKPASAVIHSGEDVEHPSYSDELHHEVELVLLIGKTIKHATDNEAEDAIAGYGVGLDMTLRDVQSELKSKGHPWTLAKGFDTSAVLSEFILKEEYELKGTEKIALSVNGEVKQSAALDALIFPPAELLKYITSKFTLEEGDLVFTGTPAGVGKVEVGDEITAAIENIGYLETKVIKEPKQ